ncbi:hypothetical protein AB0M95_12510 [Sphaerisporangium sp. NPDC051017]
MNPPHRAAPRERRRPPFAGASQRVYALVGILASQIVFGGGGKFAAY